MMKEFNYYFLLAFTMLFGYANAQMDWIDFENNGENEQAPELSLLNDSTIRVDFFGTNRFNKIKNDTIYDVLQLPGMNGRTVDVGFPELPTKSCFIEMAVDTPSISIISEDFILIDNKFQHRNILSL